MYPGLTSQLNKKDPKLIIINIDRKTIQAPFFTSIIYIQIQFKLIDNKFTRNVKNKGKKSYPRKKCKIKH